MCTPPGTPWPKLLDEATEEYNNTPHQVTKFTPNYLMYGKLPYESPIVSENIYPPVEEARQIAWENTKKDFLINKRRKLNAIFSGPFKIVKKISDVSFLIDKPNILEKSKTTTIHSTRLRHFYKADDFKLIQRPSRIPIRN
ncbi:hypothetical protein RF55_23697 [Lasius niger]|uniref:Uncharacterized protein n=1 Tax=Lasius niger TaxID=67767 RepID=A0A0J7JVT5_LASNI|nr:hypothetical protein RF55_23697 [Lasius niger]